MKMPIAYILLWLSSLMCAALPPLFPTLVPRLHEAIASNHLDNVRSLLALSADPNHVYENRTALQTAAVYKNPDVIRCLLANGADLTDDIIDRLLRSGNEHYVIRQVIASLNILLDAGAHKGDVFAIPRGYLTPVMLAYDDSEAIHNRVTKMIQNYGKQKIA